MEQKPMLTRIEHHLLSMQVDDSEPLFILYADTKRDVEGASLKLVLKALIKLIEMDFSKCIVKKGKRWQVCRNLTLADLEKRFEGQTEEEKFKYPMHMDEYYFEITENGKREEAKEIYDPYYPED